MDLKKSSGVKMGKSGQIHEKMAQKRELIQKWH